MNDYALPHDTAQYVKRYENQCQHVGLLLEKYIPRAVLNKDKVDAQARQNWLDKNIAERWRKGAAFDAALWEAANARWKRMANDLCAQVFDSKLDGRLVVGLGANTVLETGLTFHRTWGLPIIPGSALKGLARAWAAATEQDKTKRKELFGSEPEQSPLSQGNVIFLDALPVFHSDAKQRMGLVVDIMNPHAGDYYGDKGKTPPAGYLNPVPVFFLVVQGGAWRFGVAPRTPDATNTALTTQAAAWLEQALRELGAGGKTSAGYGYFM